MTGTPFAGKIPVADDGEDELALSAFNKTEWDTDTPTIKGMTVHAFRKTAWDNDSDDAETQVRGFIGTVDNWK